MNDPPILLPQCISGVDIPIYYVLLIFKWFEKIHNIISPYDCQASHHIVMVQKYIKGSSLLWFTHLSVWECSVNASVACVGRGTPSSTWAGRLRLLQRMKVTHSAGNKQMKSNWIVRHLYRHALSLWCSVHTFS